MSTNLSARSRSSLGWILARSFVALMLVAMAIGIAGQAFGQEIELTAPRVADQVSVEAIDAAMEQSESIEDADLKAALAKQYAKAKQKLIDAQTHRKSREQFDQLAGGAASQQQRIESEREQLSRPVAAIDQQASIEQLRQRLQSVKAELATTTELAQELTSEPTRRQNRIKEIPGEIKTLEDENADIGSQLSQPPTFNETEAEADARTLLLRAKRVAADARLAELKAEQNAYVATADILVGQREVAEQKMTRLRSEQEQLENAIALIEDQQAGDLIVQLRRELSATPEPLRPLAERNLELAQSQREYSQQLAVAKTRNNELLQTIESVKKTIQSSRDRLDSIGMTDALGLMLRGKRREFEQLQVKYQPDQRFREQIQSFQVNLFKLEDEQTRVQAELAEMLTGLSADDPSLDQPTSRIGLTKTQKRLISETLTTQNEFQQTVLGNETERDELLKRIGEFDEFVDEHVFWLRSAKAFSLGELADVPVAAAWLADSSRWRDVLNQYISRLVRRPIGSVLAIVALAILLFSRPRLIGLIRHESSEAAMINATYGSTLRTLVATVGLAAFWPSLFALAGWALVSRPLGSPFVVGVGTALGATAVFIASRELLKEVCRNNGLGEAHFGWDESIRGLVRRHLPWYTALGGLLVLGSFLLHEHPNPNVRTTSERLTTVMMFVVIAIFHHLVLRPGSPVYRQLRETTPGTRTDRYRLLIWLIMVGSPLLFAGLAMAGYLDTASRLGRSLQSSVLLLVIVVMGVGMLFRLLSLHRRDTARREAKLARERLVESAKAKSGSSELIATEIIDDAQTEEQIDLPTLDRQTRQTVMILAAAMTLAGLATIWRDMLPALKILDKLEAWSVGSGDSIEIVSVRDLIFAGLGAVATWFAVRQLPGMLELMVLRRSSLDSGAKYAILSIFRYLVVIFGGVFVLGFLAVPWSQMGWLLAAISVGLGFGLQEIVANFVSGIILLIERPVRVGDVITIDDTTGVVSRIHMRATTVTSWDRKELVVPNKDLVTEKLLNWSLSNVINRLSLTVGVGYDSDPDEVRKILDKVVRSHPETMSDPAPLINLDQFGDSSLNFVVRFYLPNLDNRVSVTHDINAMIKEAFDDAGISIPFPQRDIRVELDPGPSAGDSPLRPAS